MSTSIGQLLSDYYLLGQAADHLGVAKTTIWRWTKTGKLRAYRIGREVLIEKAELEKLRR